MLFRIFVKLLALYLCSVAVNGLDGISNEYVNDDRISMLSNHIEDLKNLLDRSPRHNNNYGRQSFWPNTYNREADYEIYLRQYYIEPILDSLKEISERINIITAANNSPQSFYGQFPGKFESSYGSRFGTVHGWGASDPSRYPSHGISGDSSHSLSFALNDNTSSNATAGHQPLGIAAPSTIPLITQHQKFGTGYNINAPSGQFSGVASDYGSYLGPQESSTGSDSTNPSNTYKFDIGYGLKVPSNTQPNKFDAGFGSTQYAHSQSFGSGSGFSNKPFHGLHPIYNSGQSSYTISNPLSVSSRFPDDDDNDTGKNWGIVDESDGDKVNTQPTSVNSKTNAQPNCNCEASNDNIGKSAPIQLSRTVPTSAATCKAVVLSCCAPGVTEKNRRDCFASQGCVRSYDTGLACLPVVIHAVYKELYANL